MNGTDASDSCYSTVVRWSTNYKLFVHGYASLIICIAGSMTNIINIIVLTRKNMISPAHIVLTGLATSHLALLLNYIPFTWHQYLRPLSEDNYTWGWTFFALWPHNFSLLYRTISIWMTILLAVWRYIAVVHHSISQDWCNIKTTYRAVVVGYVLSLLLSIPAFISNTIVTDGIKPPMLAQTNKNILNVTFPLRLSVSIHIFMKLVPSVVLTILSLRLVYALQQRKTHRQELIFNLSRKNSSDRENQLMDRTTRMILVVLFLFLMAEVPNGILNLLVLIHSDKFHKNCYSAAAEILTILKMIDAAIQFPVYYFMSCKFRETFHTLFNHNQSPVRKNLPSNETTEESSLPTTPL